MHKTKLPIETLDELIGFIEDYYNNLTCGDMPDSEGKCFDIAKYQEFLKNLRGIYWHCAGCGRLVAPDEEFEERDEDYYCKKCSEEI